ncbi:MAG: aggregation factor core [Paracoccaceae bacterium]
MKSAVFAAMLGIISSPVAANIQVDFREGAPKDQFILTNVGPCALNDLAITIDLTNSVGKLIFDVTGEGEGVQAFQPFEIVSGGENLVDMPIVLDGEKMVTLRLSTMESGGRLVFTTDLDDTIDAREITVSGSEFAGTAISVTSNETTGDAVFAEDPSTVASLQACKGV